MRPYRVRQRLRRDMMLVRAAGRMDCRVIDFDDVDEGGCREGSDVEGRQHKG